MGVAPTIDNHVVRALKRLVTQYKSKPKIQGLLEGLLEDVQDIEDTLLDLRDNRTLLNATGTNLDNIGAIVGQVRNAGQSDDDYRLEIQQRIFTNKSQGTTETIIRLIDLLTNSDVVEVRDGAIASFEVELQNPDTLTQDQIDALYAAIRAVKAAGVRLSDISSYTDNPFTFDGGKLVLPLDSDWVVNSSLAVGTDWRDVCWSEELGIFVAVAVTGTNRVGVSTDGLSWFQYPSADEGSQWNEVIWVKELSLFVAVASAGTGRCMTSSDGRNWTLRTIGTLAWRGVCWSPELGLLVAVASTGTSRISTSPDGITWTTRSPAFDEPFFEVCWSPELRLFVTVAEGPSAPERAFQYSSDGITWTATDLADIPATNVGYRSVDWSPELGLFVAVAFSGVGVRTAYSSDGLVWTLGTIDDNAWNKIIWVPELLSFWAVASGGTNRIQKSFDGLNWQAVSSLANGWQSIVYGKKTGTLVAVASSGSQRSAKYYIRQVTEEAEEVGAGFGDLITDEWEEQVPSVDNLWFDVAWSGPLGLFAAVASSGTLNRIMTSPDGKFWTTRTTNANENQWNSIVWADGLGLFVALGNSGTDRCYTSPDGVNWTARTVALMAYRDLCWSEELGLLVGVASTGTNRVITSPDGITWTQRVPASDQEWRCVTYSPELNLFVAGASNSSSAENSVMYSADGITWSHPTSLQVPAGIVNHISVAWSPELNKFSMVANAGTNRCWTSSNGITWADHAVSETFTDIVWVPETMKFYSIENSGGFDAFSSVDGFTWVAMSGVPATAWTGLCWAPELGLLVAVANDTGNTVMTNKAYSVEGGEFAGLLLES